MPRTRSIRYSFFQNDVLAGLTPYARLCFAGLWTIADREGRLEDRPKKIKGALFAFEDVDVESLLTELSDAKFIVRYEVDDCKYIWIKRFKQNQHPHKDEKPSEIPEYSERKPVQTQCKPSAQHCVSTDVAPVLHQPNTPVTVTVTGPCNSNQLPASGGSSSESIATLSMLHEGDFKKFYDAYAKKSARGAARVAYFAALRKATADELLEAASAYSLAYAGRVHDMKAPAAWLDGECWCDDRENWRPPQRNLFNARQEPKTLSEPVL